MSTVPHSLDDSDLRSQQRWRRRARKFLRKLPRRSNVERYPLLKYLGPRAKRIPDLWSWKRPQVIRAYYIGWVLTLLPIGLQGLAAIALAIVFKANLPVAVGLQFVSNPLTAAPLLFSTYSIGKGVLWAVGAAPAGIATGIALNLLIGGVVLGLLIAAVSHLIHLLLSERVRRRNARLAMRQITS